MDRIGSHRLLFVSTLLVAVLSRADATAKVTTCVQLKKNTLEITASHAGKTVWRKKLPAYQSLFAAGQSPDNRYLFVWHQWWPPVQPGQRPRAASSRRVKLYQVADGKLLADFSPGFGGTLQWVAGRYLVHDWGCGTNCAPIAIYDTTGKTVRTFTTSGGYRIDRRGYIAIYPTVLAGNAGVRLYEVKTDRLRVLIPPDQLKEPPRGVVITTNAVVVRLAKAVNRFPLK